MKSRKGLFKNYVTVRGYTPLWKKRHGIFFSVTVGGTPLSRPSTQSDTPCLSSLQVSFHLYASLDFFLNFQKKNVSATAIEYYKILTITVYLFK